MIFSIGVRHRTVRPVEFVCPRCGLDRTGTQIVPARWARMFGAPVVPLGEHNAVIVCDDCGHESDVGVLDVPTTDQLAGLLDHATVAAMVSAIRSSDPSRTEAVFEHAAAALRAAGYETGQVDLDREVSDLTVPEVRLHLRRLGRELTSHGKQGFLHRAAAVAMAGAALDPAARDALISMGRDLGMATPHINGVLAVAASHVDA